MIPIYDPTRRLFLASEDSSPVDPEATWHTMKIPVSPEIVVEVVSKTIPGAEPVPFITLTELEKSMQKRIENIGISAPRRTCRRRFKTKTAMCCLSGVSNIAMYVVLPPCDTSFARVIGVLGYFFKKDDFGEKAGATLDIDEPHTKSLLDQGIVEAVKDDPYGQLMAKAIEDSITVLTKNID
jgi:hypothetical protein